jgi:hypothetical protein
LWAGVQGAVKVTFVELVGPVFVSVEVTSLIGTKELQNWEALRATKIALQAATLSRASMSKRPIYAAEIKGDKNARVATIEAEEMYMFTNRPRGVIQSEERRVYHVLCHPDRRLGATCSTTAGAPDIVARSEAA